MLCRIAWAVKSRPLGGRVVSIKKRALEEGRGGVPDEPEKAF